MKSKIVSTALIALSFIHPCFAEAQTALARHGLPQLKSDFKHFPYVNPDARKGGEIRLSTVGAFESVNPFIVKGGSAEGVMGFLYDSLMKRSANEPFSLYPLIAEKVDKTEDHSSITFYINPKARFHDGSPITAQDVEFTIKLLAEKGLPRYKQYTASIDNIVIKDSLTIQINFKKAKEGHYDPEIPMIMALFRPLSKKALEGVDFASSGMKPILGSGPYKIKSTDQGKKIVYERVADYWAKDLPVNKGQYNFDTIRIDYYKNAESQFQGFTGGEFGIYFAPDFVTWERFQSLPAVKTGAIVPVHTVHQRPVPVRAFIMNLQKPVFQDIRVRKAFFLAFDGDTVCKMLFKNSFKRPTSLFANTELAPQGKPTGYELDVLNKFKDRLDPIIFDDVVQLPKTDGNGNQRDHLAKADALLKEAGWHINKMGKRVDASGKPLVVEFMLKEPKWEKIILSFQRSLKQLGIDLVLKMVDSAQYETRVTEREFDFITHTWANSLSPGVEQIYYYSPEQAKVKGSGNYYGLEDPLVSEFAQHVVNAKSREELIGAARAMDRVFMHQYYCIPLSYDNSIYWAYWKKNLQMPPIDPLAGFNVMEWGWMPEGSQYAESASVVSRLVNWVKGVLTW